MAALRQRMCLIRRTGRSSVANRAIGEMFVVESEMREHQAALVLIGGRLPVRIENFGSGRRFGAGSRWQSRHHPMVSGAACRISGMVATAP